MAAGRGPPPTSVRCPPRAPAIRVPLLAIVAEQDAIIPPVHSKRLFDAWGGPKRWVAIPHADHNDVAGTPEFWAAVTAFLREVKDR